jgi:hypothetical protein
MTGGHGLSAGPRTGPLVLVESYWPGVTAERVAAADAETLRALAALADRRSPARYLGSMLVPDDELLLRLFAGGAPELVRDANVRAGVPVERAVEIVALPQARAKK